MLIKNFLQVSRERRLSFVVFICLLLLWLGLVVLNFVMGVWTRLLPWLKPPYLLVIVICLVFIVYNIENEQGDIHYVTEYKRVYSFDSNDSKSDSTPSEKRSFSTSSTNSLRARALVNGKVDNYTKGVPMNYKCKRQMDDNPITDLKSDSTPSEKGSFSTSSATSCSLRARDMINGKVENYMEELLMNWKCKSQMDDNPITDLKSDSTPSVKRSFSTSSTTSSSWRAREDVNGKVKDYIKEMHMKWKCERQMDDSPWESPIMSSPPIHKMGMGKHQEGKKYREAFDEVLVSLVHEQTLKKVASFNDEWWKAIIDGLFDETEIRYTKTQIKDRLNRLYSKWKAWNKVMNTPGFDWDPVEKIIKANDNNWTSYIKVNPESKKLRASTFPMYEELTTIFNSIDAASLLSFTISARVNTNASHLPNTSNFRSSSSDNNSVKTNDKGMNVNLHKSRRTRDVKPSDIDSSDLLEVVKVLVELVKHKDRGSIRPTVDASSVSITACVKMLQEIEGVNNQSTRKFFFKAIEMFQSPGWREAFVAMTVDQRLRWLNNLKCV